MKKRYLIVLIILTLLVSSCKQHPIEQFPKNQDMNDTAAYYLRITQMGTSDLLIYGNGSAYYVNPINRSGPIAKQGVLSPEKTKYLIYLFYKNKFFSMKDEYDPPALLRMTDMGSDIVYIRVGNKTKFVDDYGGSGPSGFKKIISELLDSVKDLPDVKPENIESMCHAMVGEYILAIPNASPHYDNQYNYCLQRAVDPNSCEKYESDLKYICYVHSYYEEHEFTVDLCGTLKNAEYKYQCFKEANPQMVTKEMCDGINQAYEKFSCYQDIQYENISSELCAEISWGNGDAKAICYQMALENQKN